MTGGLMQLVAYGAQDIYLTGDPSITYFKNLHRRHTNFAMESIEQTLSGTANFGGQFSCTIARSGDLVNGLTLEVTLPHAVSTGANGRWTDSVGHYLIQEVEVEVGGQMIDKHYGDWLEIWSQLTLPSSKAAAYYQMIGTDGDVGIRTPTAATNRVCTGTYTDATGHRMIYVPLQFWFCRNVGLALPLIALQYHEVKVNFTLNTLANLSTNLALAAGETLDVRLYADYVYLDTDERRRFAQVSHEYLIEQLQFNGDKTYNATTCNIDMTFNHPVKELVWVARQNTQTAANQLNNYTTRIGDATNTQSFFVRPNADPTATNAIDNNQAGTDANKLLIPSNLVQTAKLQLNGQDRFSTRDGIYFNLVQPSQHHTRIPDSPGINVYSFALKPEDHQPSGTCNFSRIDNARLELTMSPYTGGLAGVVKLYATNYNVFRVMSGMGGTAYSN